MPFFSPPIPQKKETKKEATRRRRLRWSASPGQDGQPARETSQSGRRSVGMALLRDFATWRFEPAWAPGFARFPASTLLAGRAKNKIGARCASKHRLDRAIGRRRGESRLAAAQVAWPVPARPPSSSSRMASPRGALGKVLGRCFAFRLFFLLSRPHLSPPSRFAFSPSLRFFFLLHLLHLFFFFFFLPLSLLLFSLLGLFFLPSLFPSCSHFAPCAFFSGPASLNGFDPCRLLCVSRTRRPIACRAGGEKERCGKMPGVGPAAGGPSCALRRARLDCGLFREINGGVEFRFLRRAFWLSIVLSRLGGSGPRPSPCRGGEGMAAARSDRRAIRATEITAL